MRGIWKSTFREIKASLGRFMAIFAIIALGVGFFAGLKVTKAGMVATVTDYMDEHRFYDYRLISTLGFGQDAVDSFAEAQDVAAAEGAVSFDILYRTDDGGQGVVKVHSVTERTNTLKLVAGRMPEEGGECVADGNWFKQTDIGSVLYLSADNKEEDLERFARSEYTIVGIVQSPLYIQYERGNTALGTGRVDAFVYLPPDGFAVDYFTEIYVQFAQDYPLYSKGYDAFMDGKASIWKKLAGKAAEERYWAIRNEAESKIADGRAELSDAKTRGETELGDALARLEEGRQALADARAGLEEGEETLQEKEQEYLDAQETIARNETKLDESEAEIARKESELVEAQNFADVQEIRLWRAELDMASARAELRSGKEALESVQSTISKGEAELNRQKGEVVKRETDLQSRVDAGEIGQNDPAYLVEQAYIQGIKSSIETYESQLASMRSEVAVRQQKLNDAEAELDRNTQLMNDGWSELVSAKQQLSGGQLALLEARREIAEGRKALEEAKSLAAEGKSALAEGRQELEEARETIAEKEAELADGRQEYEDALKEFNEKIADGEAEIAEAEAELADLSEPDTYVLGRTTNVGYVCFENDSNIVEGIANIFPVFFFLVAALVCITTMNRMVEEQRTQIGVLKALGYRDFAIMTKYLAYSGLAALAGCIFGFFFGTWGFPKVIWFCYGIMYKVQPIGYLFDGRMAAVSLAVSLLCSIGTTWLSCRMELSQVAAALMRPKAPKAGKRVFLEYVPFVWRRLNFLRKVSMRNIFRYKKRLFMMVVGISGCTALLVTGFGIKDSIVGVAAKQFREIEVYHIGLDLKDGADGAFREKLDGMGSMGLEEYTCVMRKNMDVVTDNGVKAVSLVAGTEQGTAPFLNLHTPRGEPVAYPALGEAVISSKLAKDYNISPGDMIMLRDEDMRVLTATVSGIYENYIYDYVHVSEDTWIAQMGGEPDRKTVYLNFAGGGEKEGSPALSVHEFAARLMKMEGVVNVTINADTMERVETMLASLDIIVVVIIFCAAGLAFVVLYNLTNINITERVREIATIKVLGFYRNETSAYVFRENLMLTALGMAAGLLLGVGLHRLVMDKIDIDMIAFYIHVEPVSFLYSALLTFGFAWVVDLAMGRKLEGISMTESLKSVD